MTKCRTHRIRQNKKVHGRSDSELAKPLHNIRYAYGDNPKYAHNRLRYHRFAHKIRHRKIHQRHYEKQLQSQIHAQSQKIFFRIRFKRFQRLHFFTSKISIPYFTSARQGFCKTNREIFLLNKILKNFPKFSKTKHEQMFDFC